MPFIDCLRSTPIPRTPRVLQLEGLFDVPPTKQSEQRFRVALPIDEFTWNIGAIVGPSGSGKSTVAREAFRRHLVRDFRWPAKKSLVDGFPGSMSIKEITGLLAGVGFSSPPSWLRPFRSLSTGEQFRAGLARALAESPALVVVDEFTSSVDRIVARTASAAVAKFARRSKRKLVAVTCHDDVIDWLDPDWILQMPNGEFTRRSLRSRPAIEMEVVRAHRSAWNLFRAHHYLDTELHRSAKCFVAVVFGRPAAFASVIPHPVRGGFCWREHRTVCLPDFQGAGIGNRLSEFVASLMVATGRRFHSTTGNPAMIRHRLGSHLWQMTRKPSLKPYERHEWVKGLACARTRATARITAGFRYVGAPNFNDSARLAIAPFVSSRV